jgi:hypothetical protein
MEWIFVMDVFKMYGHWLGFLVGLGADYYHSFFPYQCNHIPYIKVGDSIVINNVDLWDSMSHIEKVQIGCGWCCSIVSPSMVFESMAQQNLFCLTPEQDVMKCWWASIAFGLQRTSL